MKVEVLYIGKYMSLLRSLRRGSTVELLNRGLDTSVIKDKNRSRKREGGRGGGGGKGRLSMVAMYSYLEKELGMHLIYSQIL